MASPARPASRLGRRSRRNRSSSVVAVLGLERLGLQALLGSQRTITASLPCVTMTRCAPVAAIARCRPGQSAWSRQHEAAVDAAAAARAAQLHPAAGEGVAEVAEAAHPGLAAAPTAARGPARAAQVALSCDLGDQPRRRQRDAGRAVGAVQRLDRAVHDDRPDRRIDAGQDALRLAEAVAEQHAGAAGGGIARATRRRCRRTSRACGRQR